LIVALLSAAMMAGCGGGSGTSSTTGSTESTTVEASTQFPTSNGDAKFVKFGTEAPSSERDAANAVLQVNFKARAAADFKAQCATLDQRTLREIAGPAAGGSPAADCARELRKLAQPLSGTKKVRADTLDQPIAALRMKGTHAWALFHGSDSKDYAIVMNKEGGVWKVGALLATEL
jgi:hypothetical protein